MVVMKKILLLLCLMLSFTAFAKTKQVVKIFNLKLIEEQIQKEIENGYKIISMTPIIQGNWTRYMIVVFETEE